MGFQAGLQIESVTTAPEHSLTMILADLARSQAPGAQHSASADWEAWLNALARQSAPLISSSSGRTQLAAWLDAVESP